MYHYFADKGDLVAAVIDLQSDEVLGTQQVELEQADTIEALYRWRDVMVEVMRSAGCVGGCPIGSLASELSDTDPLARARLWTALVTLAKKGFSRSGMRRPMLFVRPTRRPRAAAFGW